MSSNPPSEPPDDIRATSEHKAFPSNDLIPQPRAFPRFVGTPAPAVEPHRRGGLLLALSLGVVVLSLVILALFLPPVSLWEKINGTSESQEEQTSAAVTVSRLSAATPRAEIEGLSIAAEGLSTPFTVRVASLMPADYLAGKTPDQNWNCATSLPRNHALASRVYSLSQEGTPPTSLTLAIAPLADFSADTAKLSLNVWNAASDAWEFLPGQAALSVSIGYLPRCVAVFKDLGPGRQVGVALGVADTFSPEVAAANVRIYPAGLHPVYPNPDPNSFYPTALSGVLAPGFQTGQGYDVLPLLQNFDDPAVVDVVTIQRILENSSLRSDHARQIAAFVLRDVENPYAGVVIDYRDLPPELSDEYAAFISDLAILLHTQSRRLIVVLPTPAYDNGFWNPGAYDWAAIGRAADEVVVLLPLDPAAYQPGDIVDVLLEWAVGEISRDKLFLGLSALSVEDQGDGIMIPVGLGEALSGLGSVQLEPSTAQPGQTVTARLASSDGVQVLFGQDDQTGVPYIRYQDASGTLLRTMWVISPQVLAERMELSQSAGLGGVYLTDVMAAGVVPGLENALLAYRLGQPYEAEPFDPGLVWTVRAGEVVFQQQAGQIGQPFTFTVPEGQASITVEAQIDGVMLGSQTLAAAVPEPTAQPTPEATVAPLVLPTVDPAILAAGNIGQDFEAGVHIQQLNGTSLLPAGRSGFQWIKIDVAYTPGQEPEDQQQTILNVQGNGFKVLLNVFGNPTDLANWTEYTGQYAAYVGGLAQLGADGIEIWHEMNTSAAWTPIDPAAYTQLLGLSFSAIKTANPNTMVITGGLIPTGAAGEAGRSGTVWNDDAYYAGLAQAGAAQFTDCIGVSYTQGTLPPDSTSGDPRGSDPGYYLPTATDRAWNAFGGSRPVCYTDLGYLSPEGLAPVPAGYEWAQATTTAQQAQWLSDAVRLSRDSGGKVRLLIVWNMDFTAYDPTNAAAGYAILRPGGACPACDALVSVLKP